ncbi:hypothetical protein V6C27_05040 [Peptococcaceae bacterium 1198_IL3148]
MKSKLVSPNAIFDDGASVDKVQQEIEQEAKNNSSQANRSKKGSAIAVAIDCESYAVVTSDVFQTNEAVQVIDQFHIPINANVDDVAGLFNGIPLLSQMGSSLKVENDNEGNLIVNGRKIPAAKLGQGLNTITVGQQRSSQNNTSEGGK